MSAAWTLIARDVRRGYAGGGAGLVCGFFLLAVILFPFAIGPDRVMLARIGAGWALSHWRRAPARQP